MPRTIRERTIFPVAIRELSVVRAVDLTPRIRRVTLTGSELDAFVSNGFLLPEFRTAGFDDDVVLVFPYPGEADPVLPIQKDGAIEFRKGRRPLAKTFTVRRYDKQARELDLDFINHGAGTAITWSRRCAPGDRIHVAGPAWSASHPAGVDWLLVVGDETALPAIGRLLEELPAGTRVRVFAEVADATDELDLATAADAEITWVHRGSAPPGTTTVLADAVQAAPWWDGSVFAWVAGEALSIKPLRRYLKVERGVPAECVEVIGYWRHSEVETLADDPTVPDPDRQEEPFLVLHELAEVLPPQAIRVAVTLGIPDLLSTGVDTAPALAQAAGADPVALGKLLRYLAAIEIVEHLGDGRYRLTAVGEELTSDEVRAILHLDSPHARREAGFAGLLDSVRSGRSSFRQTQGLEYVDLRAQPDFEAACLAEAAVDARTIATAVAQCPPVAGTRSIVLLSDMAPALAAAMAAADAAKQITIAALPSQLPHLQLDLDASILDAAERDRIALHSQSRFEAPPRAERVLLVRLMDEYVDVDAAHLLRQASAALGPEGRLLVLEDPMDEHSMDDHAGEADLLALCLYGSGHRTDAEYRAVFEAAHLAVEAVHTVGWGKTLYVLAR